MESPGTFPRRRSFYPLLAALAAMFALTVLPQIELWLVRSPGWPVPFVYYKGDQSMYLAYVNALLDGRPRRNDPFTGRDRGPWPSGGVAGESYLSIQFIPAYVLSCAARIAGAPAASVFAGLRVFSGVASILIFFWLIVTVTGDEFVAAAGALGILCGGTLVTSFGPAGYVLRLLHFTVAPYAALPFLRLYEPAFAFPFFFVFCLIIWRILDRPRGRLAYLLVAAAGINFAFLVFSYFYLWTAAAALLACIFALWLVVRPPEWQRSLALLGAVGLLALAALLPYFTMLGQRFASLDSEQILRLTHRPQILQLPELAGLGLIAALVYAARRGMLSLRDPAILFACALALAPAIMFNQQVVTGRSLQAFHYELFIADYCVLLAMVLGLALLARGRRPAGARLFRSGILLIFALACFGWGLWETHRADTAFAPEYKKMNDGAQVARRLAELGHGGATLDTRSVVLASDHTIAEFLPTVAPQPVLWTQHIYTFSRCPLPEERERYFKYLYFTGRDVAPPGPPAFPVLAGTMIFRGAAMGKQDYYRYVESLDRAAAGNPLLAYVVTSADEHIDLSNLDKWYQRDSGEQLGKYLLYRVTLRP